VRYHETPPPLDLAPFLQCVWELEGDGAALAGPIFPDGRIELVIHLADRPALERGGARQPSVMVVGQMTAALRLRPPARLHCVGLRFTPAGARAWLRVPAHELTGRVEAFEDITGRCAARLRETAAGARHARERAGRLLAEARAVLLAAPRPPRALEAAVSYTLQREGRATVDAMARAAESGARRLERLFLDGVGLPPKTFARLVRFHHALQDLQRGAAPAQVAAARGFADQSHLAREFKRIAGVPAREIDFARVAFVQDGTPAAHPD
jgi:methylphosphotriester-DNA--protein-cysteine methyltransferase